MEKGGVGKMLFFFKNYVRREGLRVVKGLEERRSIAAYFG